MTLYKVLGPNAESIHGGSGSWHKPSGKRPGRWMPAIADPECCERGYHLVEIDAVVQWLTADCTIWEAEGRGASHTDGSGKTAYAQARLLRRVPLNERDMRLFAADCAEHVVRLFEAQWPDDDRPRQAIDAARAFARGEIGREELSAAQAAAQAAARAAAWTAAQAAAWTAAWTAAQAAAQAAARAAAQTAAQAAAWTAAWTAARTAAWTAAQAAAWTAARTAARTAAQTAAWTAERKWQGERLATYLDREGQT